MKTVFDLSDAVRMLAVLDSIFCGLHHLPHGHATRYGQGLRVTYPGDFATFDGDTMTRAVLAAHHFACRVSVGPAGPHHLAVCVWPRQRDGSNTKRHPDIATAINVHAFEKYVTPEWLQMWEKEVSQDLDHYIRDEKPARRRR